MESTHVYIVVLRNLDLPDRKLCMTSGRIASHAVHAAVKLQRALGCDVSEKWIIILSVANNVELETVCQELNRERIQYVEYRDVDDAFQGQHLTAIATFPMEKNQSGTLKKLRPWRCACNEI